MYARDEILCIQCVNMLYGLDRDQDRPSDGRKSESEFVALMGTGVEVEAVGEWMLSAYSREQPSLLRNKLTACSADFDRR